MKLIFIRHAEPDYINDSLTEKGFREAELLAERVKNWNITKAYVSPQGRAQRTAEPSLKALNIEAEVLPFLHEYSYKAVDPITGKNGVAWDYVPSYFTNQEFLLKEGDAFLNAEPFKANPEFEVEYNNAINGIDNILKEYGYIREGRYYRNIKGEKRYLTSTVSPEGKIRDNSPYKEGETEPTLVFFCHLGITALILSHLMNIPFELITHGFYMAPTSVTILSSEERWDNEAYFRAQVIGDCHHLLNAGEKISPAGYFAGPFQG